MAWIESHQEVGAHPKLKRLARHLEVSRPTAVGHLHYLWWWCLSFAVDGDLSKFDVEEIAEGAEWEGNARPFVTALIKTGWLDEEPLRVHDWMTYAHRMVEHKARRSTASESGLLGNHVRWHRDRNFFDSDCVYCKKEAKQ